MFTVRCFSWPHDASRAAAAGLRRPGTGPEPNMGDKAVSVSQHLHLAWHCDLTKIVAHQPKLFQNRSTQFSKLISIYIYTVKVMAHQFLEILNPQVYEHMRGCELQPTQAWVMQSLRKSRQVALHLQALTWRTLCFRTLELELLSPYKCIP